MIEITHYFSLFLHHGFHSKCKTLMSSDEALQADSLLSCTARRVSLGLSSACFPHLQASKTVSRMGALWPPDRATPQSLWFSRLQTHMITCRQHRHIAMGARGVRHSEVRWRICCNIISSSWKLHRKYMRCSFFHTHTHAHARVLKFFQAL